MSYLAGKAVPSLFAICLATSTATAQTSVAAATGAIARLHEGGARLVRARRATAPIAVDGRLDDAAWAAAELASDFVQQRPQP